VKAHIYDSGSAASAESTTVFTKFMPDAKAAFETQWESHKQKQGYEQTQLAKA
jgi:hypothetical protein